jgi:ABC-type ATPase with predicted acetyltransferase domain
MRIKVGNTYFTDIEQLKVAITEEKVIAIEDNNLSDYRKLELSKATDSYIQQKLSSIDEDLADLVSEKSWLEGVFAAHSILPEEVRNATVAVILGQKTVDEAVSDLSIPSDLVPDFQRAVEIAKIIAWKESIWKKEAELEAQIDSMTLEELLQLDVKKLCEDAYSEIPLEV